MFTNDLPPVFHRRVIELTPDRPRPYDQTEWCDSIVFVERGQIELESTDGSRHPFASGDLLCLHGLPLRALHTTGREPAVLVAVSRLTHDLPGK
jgi:hypothetical protein